MKSRLLTILIIFSFQPTLSAQVATIQDQDGWTNVREKPTIQSEVIYKILENDVFWYYATSTHDQSSRVEVRIPKDKFFSQNQETAYITGFIHKYRLLPLENLEKFSALSFRCSWVAFDSTNRFIESLPNGEIIKIDGNPTWGADGTLPKSQIKSIEVKLDGQNIPIHQVFYKDLYNHCRPSVSIFKKAKTYFVIQSCSDGAGAYQVVWVFDKKGLKQRFLFSIN